MGTSSIFLYLPAILHALAGGTPDPSSDGILYDAVRPGHATFYDFADGTGACMLEHLPEPQYVGAIGMRDYYDPVVEGKAYQQATLCGAYAKVEGFAFLPITIFTSAITTFVGQNLGAGELRRTRQGARFGILCSVIIAEAVGALLYWLAPILIKAFTQEPVAIAFGVQKMRTCSLFFCLLALSHCLAAVMRGAGRAVIPMISMLSFWCVVRVAIITVATPIYQSIAVVNWVYPITWALSSIFLLIYYYKADWLTAPGHRSGEPVKH